MWTALTNVLLYSHVRPHRASTLSAMKINDILLTSPVCVCVHSRLVSAACVCVWLMAAVGWWLYITWLLQRGSTRDREGEIMLTSVWQKKQNEIQRIVYFINIYTCFLISYSSTVQEGGCVCLCACVWICPSCYSQVWNSADGGRGDSQRGRVILVSGTWTIKDTCRNIGHFLFKHMFNIQPCECHSWRCSRTRLKNTKVWMHSLISSEMPP